MRSLKRLSKGEGRVAAARRNSNDSLTWRFNYAMRLVLELKCNKCWGVDLYAYLCMRKIIDVLPFTLRKNYTSSKYNHNLLAAIVSRESLSNCFRHTFSNSKMLRESACKTFLDIVPLKFLDQLCQTECFTGNNIMSLCLWGPPTHRMTSILANQTSF